MRSLCFDTETTALLSNSLLPDKHQPRIIDFYAHIVEDDGTVLKELEFSCYPGFRIDTEITKITGFTPEDLEGLPPFRDHANDVRAIIQESEAVVAHNLSFDFNIVNLEFMRLGSGMLPEWPFRRICTVEQTEFYKGHRLSLTALHEYLFGEGFPAAHRAKTDVMALTRCFLELRRRGDV